MPVPIGVRSPSAVPRGPTFALTGPSAGQPGPTARPGSKLVKPCVPTAAKRLQLRVLRGPNALSIGKPFGPTGSSIARLCGPTGRDRQQVRAERVNQVQDRLAARQQMRADRAAAIAVNSSIAPTKVRILPAAEATRLVGSVVPATIAAATVPTPLTMLYPDTPDYYYRYDDGYMYRIDRTSNLISALLPLLGGGYLPGQYLPANYMSSYVPSSFSAFYPNTSSLCTRYVNGVIYYVDCQTGLIENFMPLYDNGFGVGQMLPSGYGYYNVPDQYRSMYYNSADTGYWYAPGAIYQYDPQTSLITSIAALLSPGLSIGQPLPAGYGAYNVPLGFRETYYDTPDAWYRYNNGNIYQVDPVTQVVTALVVSALT